MKQTNGRTRKTVLITLAATAVITGAGFAALRTSEWWTALTLFGDRHRVESFRRFHTLFPAESVAPADVAFPIAEQPLALPETYAYENEARDVNVFLDMTWTTGLLVWQDGRLIVEEYYRGYGPESSVTSFSVAKSVVSALVGIAIERGDIASVADRVADYLPSFAGTDYGAVTIHDLLTMSSGIGFDEDYDSVTSDINMLPVRVFGLEESVADLVRDSAAVRPPGVYNEYRSSDTIVLGLVVEAATGLGLAELLEQSIWIPAGMESPAYWNTDQYGNTLAHAFLSASLRDWLRFGILYLNDGQIGNRHIIPAEWIRESLYRSEPRLQPGETPDSDWTFGYGYQWWIPEQPKGDFAAIGIWGQYIYVHPGHDVVIVKTSADEQFDQRDHETIALFRSLARWARLQD